MRRDAACDPDADRANLAVRPASGYPNAATSVNPAGGHAELHAHADQGLLDGPDVGNDVDGIREPDYGVADELSRPVPGDLPTAVDVDHRRAGIAHWAVEGACALARGIDGLMLEQQAGIGDVAGAAPFV